MKKTRFPDITIERLEREDTGLDVAVIGFHKTGDRGHGELTVSLEILDDAVNLRRKLLGAGAPLNDIDAASLKAELVARLPSKAGRLFTTGGWKKVDEVPVFVLGCEVLGASDNVTCRSLPVRRTADGECAGTLAQWQAEVAIPALSSPITAITLLASFAAPLMAFSSLNEGFIINLAGRSSAGKSTANRLAASVWGHPDQHPSWDSTARSLAELGAASSDMPLILDDTDQNSDVAPAKRLLALFKAVDALAAGQGRSYSDAVQSSLPDLQFRCIGLSSSPETMEAFSRRTKLRRSDGHRVRLLELRVPDGENGGIWAMAGHDAAAGRVASDSITAAARASYGCAGRAWITYLLENETSLRAEVASLTDRFVRRIAPEAGGVQGRIAHKAALLYLAGRLLSRSGIIPFKKGQAREIAGFALREFVAVAFETPAGVEPAMRRLSAAVAELSWAYSTTSLRTVRVDPLPAGILLNDEHLYLREEKLAEIVGAAAEQSLLELIKERLQTAGAFRRGGSRSTKTLRLGTPPRDRRYLHFDVQQLRSAIAPRFNPPA